MTVDTSEYGMETLIFDSLVNAGWIPGDEKNYDQTRCVDLAQLSAFLYSSQPEVAETLSVKSDTRTRSRLLEHLNREVRRRGVIDTLRNGVGHLGQDVRLYYPTPTPNNDVAVPRHEQNRLSVTRQLRFSARNKNLSLDLALFVNGLPLITMEIKNNLTPCASFIQRITIVEKPGHRVSNGVERNSKEDTVDLDTFIMTNPVCKFSIQQFRDL